MKLTIVSFILTFGCLFSLRVIYDCIAYKYGKRIKLYYLNKRELKEAHRLIANARNETALKFLEANRVIDVEVEEVQPNEAPSVYSWKVYNDRRLDETIISTELIKAP